MRELEIVFNHLPIPWARPGQSGKKRFDSQANLKIFLRTFIRTQIENLHYPLVGPLSLKAHFIFPHTKKKNRVFVNKKPDLDNIIKFYLDLCTGICFLDDAQICSIRAEKIYEDCPSVRLIFGELDERERRNG